jgi:hypothetical protein
MRNRNRSLLYVLCSGMLVFNSSVWGTDAVETERITFAGRVFMEPIDTRRIVIAVATRSDGSAEHLFFYTATRPLRVTPRLRNWQGRIVYEAGRGLRLTPDDNSIQPIEFIVSSDFAAATPGEVPLRFEHTAGLSHYLANPPLRIEALKALQITGDCDRSPQHCVSVGGQYLPFPA